MYTDQEIMMHNMDQTDTKDSIGYQDNEEDINNENSCQPDELKLTKRFIELVGGIEHARELLDKCDECLECIDLIDDDDIIHGIADTMSDSPDHPTNLSSFAVTGLYNPTSIIKDMM